MQFTARTSFPYYGNVEVCEADGQCSQAYDDCEYAAAADWEIITLGIEPAEAEVIDDYLEASPSHLRVWASWGSRGIDGVHANLHDALYRPQQGEPPSQNEPTPAAVRELARTHGVLMATLLDPETPSITHEVVIAGFTPTGPVILTWGGLHQMTWAEWEGEATALEVPEVIGT